MPQQPDRLHQRFTRLRAVVSAWEIRYNQLPDQVLPLFDASDLPAIESLLEEKRRLERLIPLLREFVAKWEEQAPEEDLYTPAEASRLVR